MKVRELLNLYIRLINEELTDDDEIDVYVDIEEPDNYGDNFELRIGSEHLNLEMKAIWETEEKNGELADGDAEPPVSSDWFATTLTLRKEG